MIQLRDDDLISGRKPTAERTRQDPGPGGGESGALEPRFRATEEVFIDPTLEREWPDVGGRSVGGRSDIFSPGGKLMRSYRSTGDQAALPLPPFSGVGEA